MDNIIELEDLRYDYGDGTPALRGVSLNVGRGERIALLGPNGSGKTTLFFNLIGVLHPSGGTLRVDGETVSYDKKSLLKLRKRIGLVFQEPDTQLFCMNVLQEVAFGPANLGLDDVQVGERCARSMEQTDITHLKDKPPHFLSYGQKKRVTAASILSMEPDVLLFDEPTSALDPVHAREMVQLIERLNEAGATILISTHEMDLALAWASRVVILKDGAVLRDGLPTEVFADDDAFRIADLYQPAVYRIYQSLVNNGMLVSSNTSVAPRNVEDLEELIRAQVRGQSGVGALVGTHVEACGQVAG